jgi:ATP-dependent DNA ligase
MVADAMFGCDTSDRDRRALLDELALHRTMWQTPRAFSINVDLAAITCERHLEGVVAKRLDVRYQPRSLRQRLAQAHAPAPANG